VDERPVDRGAETVDRRHHLDRRRALGAFGAAAAGAWAAPVVLSTPARAAETPDPTPIPPIPLTLDWGAAFPNAYPSPAGTPNGSLVPPGFTTPASTTVGGRVTITFTHSDPDVIGTVISDVYRNFIVYRGDRVANPTPQNPEGQTYIPPLIGGLDDPYFLLQVDADSFATPVNRFVQTTWTFSEPVGGLTFRIDSIDLVTGLATSIGLFTYTDVVSVTGASGAATVLPSLTPVPVAPTPAGFTVAGPVATGTAFAGNGSTAGNCLVTFPAPVTSITIRYEPGRLGSNYQYVGVRDLSFTVPGP
jgi:hypothetical protein